MFKIMSFYLETCPNCNRMQFNLYRHQCHQLQHKAIHLVTFQKKNSIFNSQYDSHNIIFVFRYQSVAPRRDIHDVSPFTIAKSIPFSEIRIFFIELHDKFNSIRALGRDTWNLKPTKNECTVQESLPLVSILLIYISYENKLVIIQLIIRNFEHLRIYV